jgi:asparagine synthase (glutamine-hydrolysing)
MSSEKVRTFSVGFREAVYNEIDYARIAARHFSTEAHEYFLSADQALDAIPIIAEAFDEPFGNSSAIPTYFCLKMAHEAGVNLMFAGDGGDELFAGNERYITEKVFTLYQKLPKGLRRATDCMVPLVPDIFPLTKVTSYVQKANLSAVDRFFHYQFYFRDHAQTYFTNDFLNSLDMDFAVRIPAQHYQRVATCDPLNRLLYVDLKLAIGDNDLFKVNRSADVFGIQVVYPYLDQNLALISGKIPSYLKLRGWSKRYIFKKAFKTLLPPEILTKKKHGFGLPIGRWLRAHPGFRELARSLLLDQRSMQRGFFSRNALESLIELHNKDDGSYYGSQIWNVMMLELWHRHHHDKR